MKSKLDDLDTRILQELQQDARLSMRELGRRIGLSAPATAERVSRLEYAGVIVGYAARILPQNLGRKVMAFIGVQDSGQKDPILIEWAKKRDGVLECYSVTGENSCMLRIAVENISELEKVLAELIEMGFTCQTSIVLSNPIAFKEVTPKA
ncbi:Lrp/AsnC family transcriptional regulator [Deinococcus misasensis]|uniref:Lrp/AsnC family transcriptional regulator n=1 Tax=Deinococcus misasensis TaxID=392413 RepID=UPI000557EE4B|nr:Lrp/AsnC family transcriptional regulator [Deinococcus misasensis]